MATERGGAAPTDQRILDAAYACFERLGIAKTTIEDIARGAGVSRPTVYKYYAGKEVILDEISQRETRKVNAEVRRDLVRHAQFGPFLTETLLLVVRAAGRNVYIRRMTESHDFQLKSMNRTSAMYRLQREWWGGVLRHAADRHELATDIDADEIILWLTHSQALLLTHSENPDIDDAMLRRMISRFVVEPLLADPGTARS